MAKQTKKFGIGSTLKKKVELKTGTTKDLSNIEEKVAEIHSKDPKKTSAKKTAATARTKPAVKPAPKVRKRPEVKPAEKEEMKRLTIDIPKSLHRQLKSKVAEKDTSIKDLLNEMIKKYVNKS